MSVLQNNEEAKGNKELKTIEKSDNDPIDTKLSESELGGNTARSLEA